MGYAIYDINFNFINPKEDKSKGFTINAQYAKDMPTEEDVMVSEFPGGHYVLKTSFFPNYADLEQLFPYQLLLPQGGQENAIVMDQLNSGYTILTARVHGVYAGSIVFEKQPTDTDIRLFLSRFDLHSDVPMEKLSGYVKAKNIAPFEEPAERAIHIKRRRTEALMLTVSSITAFVSVIMFAHNYVQYASLSSQKNKLEQEISAINSRIPNETLAILEKLDKDDTVLDYFSDVAMLQPAAIKSITADGIVFRSFEPFETLKKKNPKTKIIDAENFFLPIESKLPSEVKK